MQWHIIAYLAVTTVFILLLFAGCGLMLRPAGVYAREGEVSDHFLTGFGASLRQLGYLLMLRALGLGILGIDAFVGIYFFRHTLL